MFMKHVIVILLISFSCFAQKSKKRQLPMQPIICYAIPPTGCPDQARDLSAPDAVYYPNEVKTMPRDKDGIKHFMDFIKANVDTRNLGLPKGKYRAYYSFVVEKDGSLSTVKILKTPHKALVEMITKAVAKAPKWIPATNSKGQNVRSQFSIPYFFEIK